MPNAKTGQAETLTVALAKQDEAERHRVELDVSPAHLNSRLRAIGEWLVAWEMPHQVRIAREDDRARLRISFTDADHAHAFLMTFGSDGSSKPRRKSRGRTH